jgi:tetratricopeptide (TPR) repeat protein
MPALIGPLMTNSSQLYVFLGDLGEARRQLEQTHDIVAESQDTYCHAMLHVVWADVELYQGQFQRALRWLDEARRLTRQAGEIQREIGVRVELAWAMIFLGRPDRALQHLEEIEQAAGDRQAAAAEPLFHINRARALTALGRPEVALKEIARAGEQIERRQSLWRRGLCWQAEGAALLRLGRHADAEAAFREALDFAVEHKDALTEILASAGLGELALANPETDRGEMVEITGRLRRRVEEGSFTAFAWWPDYLDGRLALQHGQREQAHVLLQRAVDQIESLAAALEDPADRAAFLESPERKQVAEALALATRGWQET